MEIVSGEPAPDGIHAGHIGPRRVYHSDPDAPTGQQLDAEFNQLASQVYVGARDGALDPELAFDLACLLAEWWPANPLISELAEQSAEGTDPEQLAGLALRVLALTTFRPGFDAEPALLAGLEAALGAVRADMRATGLAGAARLIITDWSFPPQAYAEFAGHPGSGGGIDPGDGGDPVRALVAVADDLQDAVMETLWEVWPLCPAHDLGAHAAEHQGSAVWWCNASGGHIIAPIGEWNGPREQSQVPIPADRPGPGDPHRRLAGRE